MEASAVIVISICLYFYQMSFSSQVIFDMKIYIYQKIKVPVLYSILLYSLGK